MAKISFRETAQKAGDIMKKADSGTFSPIYLLMGEESYYIDRVCDYIVSKALTEEEKEFNQTIIYGKDTSGAEVASHCLRIPMMAKYQLVVVKEAQTLNKPEELMPYIDNHNEQTILVICVKNKSLDKRGVLYKSLAKKATIMETVTPKENEIDSFIKSVVKAHNAEIEPKAMVMVAQNIGGNLNKIVSEFDKLFVRIPKDTKVITPEHIEENIGISKKNNIFELTKALSQNNFTAALKITDNLARNTKDNPLPVSISLLFTHFQRILILGMMIWQNKKQGLNIPSQQDIAKQLGVMPFFVQEYFNAVKVFPTPKAFKIIELLRQYDMKSKGVGASSTDDSILFKELILKIIIL